MLMTRTQWMRLFAKAQRAIAVLLLNQAAFDDDHDSTI